ncbi:hypothetical protein AVEN_91275-1 [Araneus ventricosus]|uniref:Uncharacterized protein n=1 Tax=Araneus ventricosus TaxID=182803 RepID=A0A4Y2EPP3_ARAVE|nr:hypothetical protein AVEN_91275-1 [Araneus ventricosus]
MEYVVNAIGTSKSDYLVETIANILTGILILTSLSICSSRLSEYMNDIKATAEFLIENGEFDTLVGKKALFYLKRIEKKNTIYLTACGVINFSRGFLLSAFGTLVTYRILISSLKLQEK